MERTMVMDPAVLCLINADLGAARGYRPKMSPDRQHVPLAESKYHVINPAHSCGALNDSIQDRLNIRGRAADDAEHLGRRCLVLQGFAQLCIAFLDLFEQTDVFDSDHSLIGESFYDSELFFGKRIKFISTNKNRSNRNTFTHERDSKLSAITFSFNSGLKDLRKLSRRYRQQILNMDRLTLDNGPARY